MKRNTLIIAAGLILLGVLGRLLPHAWNATPIVAIALMAGIYLGRKYALFVPLAAMIISDVFIGFYDAKIMLAVYGSFALVGLIGYLLRNKKSFWMIFGTSVTASVVFYLITNFAVWSFGTLYPPTFSGLIASYTMAIPFFKNMVIGDLFFSTALYGLFEYALYVKRSEQFKKVKVTA